MGNIGEKFCQGCNNVCGDGKSIGEKDLTKMENPPITNINNPFFFNNNKTSTSVTDPRINKENTENINENNNKADSYITSINSPILAEEDQKKNQLYAKNSINNINNDYNMNNFENNYNNNYNNSLNNSDEITNKFDKDQIEEKSAKKITNLFRKLLNLKKISHQKLYKEFSQISSSEYIIGLNSEQLIVDLAPEDNCLYIGNKFNDKKDGYGLEIFNNLNAKYFGIFRNNKRVDLGKYTMSNNSKDYFFFGEIEGIYANGFGWYTDKIKSKNYTGTWKNSMKSGYGIETYYDNSEYRGSFLNGKREGIGLYIWNDNSSYEGEWKENRFDGYGIYKFNDGSEFQGEWKNGQMHGFGEFNNPNIKKYYGFFQNDKRSGFGIEIWLQENKAFIGFWRNNIMHGYGKLIMNENQKFGIWEGGQFKEKLKKKNFYNKINEDYNQYSNFFQLDDYKSIVNLINGDSEDIYA